MRGSGCSRRPSRKSDVLAGLHRIEAKTTSTGSLRLERAWFEKIAQEAQATGKRPALVFGFDGHDRHAIKREDWLALPMPDAAKMFQVVDAVLRGDFVEAQRIAAFLK